MSAKQLFTSNKATTPPLTSLLTLIIGQEKGGKSTLAAGYPDSVVIDTEGGMRQFDLEKYAYVKTWPEIKQACLVAANGKNSGVIVFDSISRAYEQCRKHVLKANNWTDEREGGGFGAGFAVVRNEFRSAIDPLIDKIGTGVGVVFVTHTKTETRETATGEETIITPDIPDNKTYQSFLRMADLILHYSAEMKKDGTHRTVRAQNDGMYLAGDRTAQLPPIFRIPEFSGTPTEKAKQVFASLEQAYNKNKTNK